MSCADPIAFGQLVDYWAGDLDAAEIDRIDEHLFACESCTHESAAIARLVAAFRGTIPPIVSADEVRELAARGMVVEDNPCVPDQRREAVFPPHVDILLHRLGGLDLAAATRVRVVVKVESTGDVLLADDFVPFDRERGEVLVACQKHFQAFPPDIVFEVHALAEHGTLAVARYPVPHVLGQD